ncbi:phosphoglucomutase/phosphomannomutase family protein [Candidatus Omnitrophota bacterium]
MGRIRFGTDGWRAVIAEDFTFDNLRVLAQAVADFLNSQKRGKKHTLVIGYDARFLSQEFAHCVAEVLCANKIKVVVSHEMVPTPVVSFYTKNKKCSLGVMITASHNPCRFNGLKIKTPAGGAADETITSRVEKLLFKNKVRTMPAAQAKAQGLLAISDISEEYVRFIQKYVDLSLIKKLKLKVLIDLMHGSGGTFIEKVLKGSGIEFGYLHDRLNPSFGGVNPEPTEPNLTEVTKAMKTGRYDLGICLDGDGDRIACVLKGGRYINAQVIFPLLAVHLARNRGVSGALVKTVVGSNLVDAVAVSLGRVLFETAVGFKYISSLFGMEDVLIGGEEAGGIGVRGYIPERDATMAAVLILEMVAYLKKKPLTLINDLERTFGRWHYDRIAVPVGKLSKDSLSKLKIPSALLGRPVQRVNTLDGVKIIADSCWLMFRTSGTEPIVRIYAEARSKKNMQKLIDQGRRMLRSL